MFSDATNTHDRKQKQTNTHDHTHLPYSGYGILAFGLHSYMTLGARIGGSVTGFVVILNKVVGHHVNGNKMCKHRAIERFFFFLPRVQVTSFMVLLLRARARKLSYSSSLFPATPAKPNPQRTCTNTSLTMRCRRLRLIT
jgi:hypothetical protein